MGVVKNPEREKEIKDYDEESKFHRLGGYKKFKEQKVEEFGDLVFWRYLPRLRFARSSQEVLRELDQGILKLEEHLSRKIE